MSPRFIGPYEVIEKVGPVAYRSDHSHVISSEIIDIRPDLTYEEEPVEILTREVKELRNK